MIPWNTFRCHCSTYLGVFTAFRRSSKALIYSTESQPLHSSLLRDVPVDRYEVLRTVTTLISAMPLTSRSRGAVPLFFHQSPTSAGTSVQETLMFFPVISPKVLSTMKIYSQVRSLFRSNRSLSIVWGTAAALTFSAMTPGRLMPSSRAI